MSDVANVGFINLFSIMFSVSNKQAWIDFTPTWRGPDISDTEKVFQDVQKPNSFCVQLECHLPCCIVATTSWMKLRLSGWQGSGGTQAVHLQRVILSQRRPRVRPRHQDTKPALMTHDRNSSTRATAAPFKLLRCFYFWTLLVFLSYWWACPLNRIALWCKVNCSHK